MSVFNVFEKDRKEITGPVNVLRLEGKVDGVTKVVYLFLDHHYSAQNQTECLNVYSTDVNQYLAQTFHKLNGASRVYDFFMELNVSDFRVDPRYREAAKRESGRSGYRDIYIGRMVELIKSAVEYDPETNRTLPSKVFQNVRLHYLDIREEFHTPITWPLLFLQNDIWSMLCSKQDNFGHPIQLLTQVKEAVDSFVQVYETVSADPGAKLNPETEHRAQTPSWLSEHPLFAQTVRKLLIGYSHTNIKQTLVKLFQTKMKEFSQLSTDLENAIETYSKMQNLLLDPPITLEYGTDAYDLERANMYGSVMLDAYLIAKKLSIASMSTVAWITDCYLLRRVLDKDYITHSIIYSGGGHSRHYVQALVGDFGFSITHAAFMPTTTVTELNTAIHAHLKEERVIDDLLLPGPNPPQCSDITGFPDDFA